MYLNLKSKALYDLKKYAEARQSILQHYQNLSTVNPAVCQTSDDCFLSRRRPHCTASDSLEDPAGVNVTANDIIDASASKLPSMAWTSLVFESNEVLCRMKQQEQIYTSGRDATESLDVANQVFEPKQLDILLQTYPRYTPLWKASIFAKLNQITSFPTQPLMTSPLQKFPEIKAMIKQYNHSVK